LLEGLRKVSTSTVDDSGLARGLDLFNRAHFFDAHEVLEDVWRESAHGKPRRRHLQGLVQLAVAFHHESRNNLVGARSVLERALRNLAGAEDSFPQLDLDCLRSGLAHWQRHLAGAGPRPAAPLIIPRSRAARKHP
jgi:predicted metal-dependent hydrolase